MLSAIYVTIVILILYVYARILKDHRVFTNLLVCAALAFVVGSCIKSKCFNTNEITKSEVITTASNPTVHSIDSAVVWTESKEQYVQSQEMKSETVVPQTNVENCSTSDRGTKESITKCGEPLYLKQRY